MWLPGLLQAVVSALCSVLAILVNVLDDLLVNEQIRAAISRDLNAIAVVPLNRAVELFAADENDGHRRARLHLFYPVEIFCMRLFWWRGFLVRLWSGNGGAGYSLLLHFGQSRTKQLT